MAPNFLEIHFKIKLEKEALWHDFPKMTEKILSKGGVYIYSVLKIN